MIRLPRLPRRRVHYARQVRTLPVGTALGFPGTNMVAVRQNDGGWMVTGKGGVERAAESVILNLPAVIERLGGRR